MGCTNCKKPYSPTYEQAVNNNPTYEQIKRKANDQAKDAGLTGFAMVQTVNAKPGFMWRPIESQDLEANGGHLSPIEYYTVS
jgi:hypothetical protein